MSLRVRLAVVLTVTVLLPLLAVGIVVGVLVPGAAAQASSERLQMTLRSAEAALDRQCTALGLAARSLALEAAPALVAGDPPPGTAPEAAVGGLPGASAAVLDADGAVTVAAGGTDLAGAAGRSCSESDGLPVGDRAEQVESVPVRNGSGAVVAWAVVHSPLDDVALDDLRRRGGLPSGLLLTGNSEVLAAAVAGSGVDSAQLDAVAGVAATSGEGVRRPGEVAGARYAVVAPADGAVALVAVEEARGSFLAWAVPALLAAVAVLAAVGTVLVARRLTAPLVEVTETVSRLEEGDLDARSSVRGDDELGRLASAVNGLAAALQGSLAEAGASRDAAADALERFGEALARTHDLDGLLQTVAETAAREAGADTCVVYVEEEGGLVERAVVDLEVHSRATSARLLTSARRAVDAGTEVADEPMSGVSVVALPLLHGDRVLGAMVLAGRRRLDGTALATARSLVRPAGTAVSNVLVHREAARLSVTDPLTGLANFRSLSATLSREVERAARFARPLSVLMLDLDSFKAVNDTWGHAVGDAVLRDLGHRLRDLVREVDTVARYGGEEFAVVLPETDTAGATEVAQRVVEAVRRAPFGADVLSQPLRVTVSVGVATYPRHGQDEAELMREADAALYAAKGRGRDRWSVASGAGAGDGVAG